MNDGFLNLLNASDLFNKLEHDYDIYIQNPLDIYLAFNFFVTAEHLPDWIGDTGIKDNDPILRISSHLTTGAKHFSVTNKKKKSIDTTSVKVFANSNNTYLEVRHSITLTPKEVKELGYEQILLTDLASLVISFWRSHFENENT